MLKGENLWLAGYLPPNRGSVGVAGRSLLTSSYRPVQLVFQNPELVVNPRWRIDQILREGDSAEPAQLKALGIHPSWLRRWRYPRELSGGELQRVAIARILNPQTQYLIADERTAMLDANTQALIWQAVLAFVRQRHIGLVVISHDQPLLQRLCDKILKLSNPSNAASNLKKPSFKNITTAG